MKSSNNGYKEWLSDEFIFLRELLENQNLTNLEVDLKVGMYFFYEF